MFLTVTNYISIMETKLNTWLLKTIKKLPSLFYISSLGAKHVRIRSLYFTSKAASFYDAQFGVSFDVNNYEGNGLERSINFVPSRANSVTRYKNISKVYF